MKRNRVGLARMLIGLLAFVPLAVLALVLPAKLHLGDGVQGAAALTAPVATGGAAPPPGSSKSPTVHSPSAPTSQPGPLRSSCTSVLYVGDSTSEGVTSANYLPDPADREGAQLRAVGVRRFIPEISGARAIVEHYKGEPSGQDIVDKYVAQGYQGCWVIALGNNDAANMSIGAKPDAAGRISLLMKKIGNKPVL